MTKLIPILSALCLLTAPAFGAPGGAYFVGGNVSLNETCSGTLISDVLVLTANHCVEDQYKDVTRKVVDEKGVVKEETVRVAVPGRALKVTWKNGIEISRKVVVYKMMGHDDNIDLALVRLQDTIGGTPVGVSCDMPALQEKVTAMGNPLGVLYDTVTSGEISNLNINYRDLGITANPYDNGEHTFIMHTAPIAPGSSGGALLNSQGLLIGVNVRGTPLGDIALAVSTQDIIKFLNSNGVKVCGG